MRSRSFSLVAALGISSLGASTLDGPAEEPLPVEAVSATTDTSDTLDPNAPARLDDSKGPRIVDPTFTADPGSALKVLLLLDDGRTPVSGCRIEILKETPGRRLKDAVYRSLLAVHQTDARGIARFERVAVGRYVVAIGLGGAGRGMVEFVTVDDGVNEVRVPIRIRGICNVVGRVESPLGGCPRFEMHLAADVVAKTDQEGIYRFEGVAFGGASTIRVSIAHAKWYGKGNWTSTWREVPLAAGVVTVDTLRYSSLPKSPLGVFVGMFTNRSQPPKR